MLAIVSFARGAQRRPVRGPRDFSRVLGLSFQGPRGAAALRRLPVVGVAVCSSTPAACPGYFSQGVRFFLRRRPGPQKCRRNGASRIERGNAFESQEPREGRAARPVPANQEPVGSPT
jgi:hypothetical protein